MKQDINLSQFRDAFHRSGRENQFTHEGLKVLYDYLEEVFEESYELDVIALCCEFSEYTEGELMNDHGCDNTFKNLLEEVEEKVIGWTENTVILHN